MHQAERGLFDLRQGRVLCVAAPDTVLLLAAVEGLRDETLARLRDLGGGAVRLVVTHHRARSMGLVDGRPGSLGPEQVNGRVVALSLGLGPGHHLKEILRLSSANGKHSGPLDLREAGVLESTGLTFARLGRLLPAVVGASVDPSAPELESLIEDGTILRLTARQIEEFSTTHRVEVVHVSDAPVPLEGAEDARFILFREGNGLFEHVAVLIGERERWPDPVPVRVHSACLTGDLFGSLRCDCGEQLRGSLRVFKRNGGGVLLYLAHEGRSIGLANKLRAYTMQEEGLDTVDADCALGFGADERRYDAAVDILRHLGVSRIQLLTNNPEKYRAMEEGGIEVLDRQPLHGELNAHNLPYVSAKALRAGHWMEEMLSRRLRNG